MYQYEISAIMIQFKATKTNLNALFYAKIISSSFNTGYGIKTCLS